MKVQTLQHMTMVYMVAKKYLESNPPLHHVNLQKADSDKNNKSVKEWCCFSGIKRTTWQRRTTRRP